MTLSPINGHRSARPQVHSRNEDSSQTPSDHSASVCISHDAQNHLKLMKWRMDAKSTPTHATVDGETELLLLDLRHAHSILDHAVTTRDKPARTRYLQQATDIYIGVKDLLPKLGLAPTQSAAIRNQLAVLLSRLQQ